MNIPFLFKIQLLMVKQRVALRGHHLICLNFYQGEGYSSAFIKNLNRILKKLKKAEGLVIEGPDEVCSSCPHLKEAECCFQPNSNEVIEYLDKLALRLLNLKAGDAFIFKKIKSQLPRLIEEWERKACLDCNWRYVCLPLIGQLKKVKEVKS